MEHGEIRLAACSRQPFQPGTGYSDHFEFRMANCQAGNSLEGWESEGKFGIANLRLKSQPFDKLRAGSQNPESMRKAIKIDFILATAYLNRRMSNKEFRISK
jgi:hypothetical protein